MRTKQQAARALLLAQAKLAGFDRINADVWFTSKDHERHELVEAAELARLAYIETTLSSATRASRRRLPASVVNPPTPRAVEAATQLPGVIAQLRRDGVRRNKSSVAVALGCDRKTLDSWIEHDWIPGPPW